MHSKTNEPKREILKKGRNEEVTLKKINKPEVKQTLCLGWWVAEKPLFCGVLMKGRFSGTEAEGDKQKAARGKQA